MAQISYDPRDIDDGRCSLVHKETDCRMHHCIQISKEKDPSDHQTNVPTHKNGNKFVNKSHLKICSNPDCGIKNLIQERFVRDVTGMQKIIKVF
jgi:hypothetical protein